MEINWLILTEGPEGIPVPTYGQYGGPNWSGGKFVGDDEPGNYTVQPKDPLDKLFKDHDQAYDQPDTLLRAKADLLLIQDILRQSPDEVTGEGDLYAGAAALAMLYQIAVVNGRPELLLKVDVEEIVHGAIDRIEEGRVTPEAHEIAGLVEWLGKIGQALAASDSPVARAVAEPILDFAASLASAPPAGFQDALTDGAIDFIHGALPQLADTVEAIIDPLPHFPVEKLLCEVSDRLEDAAPYLIPSESLKVVANKFAIGDFFS
jgi:hypothetical protein